MKDMADNDRSPNPVDVHVGARVRARRKQKGISQEALASRLKLTFQQVQKYERGTNRISASKLYEIARTLELPISDFFEGLEHAQGAEGVAEGSTPFAHAMPTSSDGMELIQAFEKIRRGRVRKRFVELAKALAAEDEASDA